MSKFKGFIKSSYGKASSALIIATVPLTAFAEGTTTSVSASITASMQQVVTDTLATIAAVAPIGITIFGAMYCWKMGVKFFKGVAR